MFFFYAKQWFAFITLLATYHKLLSFFVPLLLWFSHFKVHQHCHLLFMDHGIFMLSPCPHLIVNSQYLYFLTQNFHFAIVLDSPISNGVFICMFICKTVYEETDSLLIILNHQHMIDYNKKWVYISTLIMILTFYFLYAVAKREVLTRETKSATS